MLLLRFPFSGPGEQKERPAVVCSTDLYHDEWDELLVVAVTSRPPRRMRPTDCELLDGTAAGLWQPSWVRSHLATVDRRLILRQLGTLTVRDVTDVEDCLRIAMGL